jgi:hypothetical protein
VLTAVGLTVGLAGCGGAAPHATPASGSTPHATEVNPSGDIPDNQAYVTFTAASGSYHLKVPEGWARSSSGVSTTFTDKLNSISVEQSAVASKPTVDSVKKSQVPALAASEHKFALSSVKTFTRSGGDGVVIAFLDDSAPNAVTGAVVRNAIEQYLFWKNGQQTAVTLSGPQGADNVDPWAKVTGSFAWLK